MSGWVHQKQNDTLDSISGNLANHINNFFDRLGNISVNSDTAAYVKSASETSAYDRGSKLQSRAKLT